LPFVLLHQPKTTLLGKQVSQQVCSSSNDRVYIISLTPGTQSMSKTLQAHGQPEETKEIVFEVVIIR
jgi:hypothetical protein